jgi:hypothetical protein
MIRILALIFILSTTAFAQDKEVERLETLKFDKLKEVLEKDGLSETVKNKKRLIQKKKKIQKKLVARKYRYPKENDFWEFASEFWLVKNASTLKWDFEKPDYGIDEAFKEMLEKMGIINHKFKILIINSPSVTHLSLPSGEDEGIYIISLPFMRTLDLSKREIAILLLEDYVRLEQGHFKKNLNSKIDFLNQKFVGKKPDIKKVHDVINSYSTVAFKKGFSFDQQYQVTKKMDFLLKSEPKFWSLYIKLLNKIDKLVKVNLLYKSYNEIYPSPEIQLKWLSPKKEIL